MNPKTPFAPPLLHPSWLQLYKSQLPLLAQIESTVSPPFTPPPHRALAFMSTDVAKLKVVILGQDPYPAAGVSTGRAFEVGNLSDWAAPFRQVSLKNIVRSLFSLYTGHSPYLPYSRAIEAIRDGSFPLLPPNRLFADWEEQGVLLLNTSLTCKTGEPGSHKDQWQPFCPAVFSWLSEQRPDLYWFLWGVHAQSLIPYIKNGRLFKSRHPMMCSKKYHDDFLKNPCFRDTSHIIDWRGRSL